MDFFTLKQSKMRKKLYLGFCALVLFTIPSFAQKITVTGKVTDEKGEPVGRASIIEKGTKNGVSADNNGIFSLKVDSKSTISVMALDFITKEVKAAPYLVITLSQDQKSLSEVVVTALQSTKNKNAVVYANQTVKNEDLNAVTNRSAINALQGKVAGVKITQSSGAVGASTRVVLRGETSLTGNNNALIVVDGVPLNNSSASGGGGTGIGGDRDNYVDFGNRANDINPDDIESMTILKGPAATTLYGSRGSAGVVLITTKKGKGTEGRPKVSFSSSASTERVYLVMKQQNKFGSGYKTCNGCGGGTDIFMGENFSWGAELDGRMIPWTAVPVDGNGNPLPLNNGKIEQLIRPYSYVKNHLSSFFDYGSTFRNNVSIDGGDGKYSYYLSYTNFDNKGIISGTNYKKNNILLNATANFSKKLSSNFSLNYTKINQRGATEGGYPFGYSSGTPAYSFALQTPVNIPFSEMRDYNSPYQDFKGFYAQYSINPYYILGEQEVRNTVDNILASAALNYTPFNNLTITGKASTNIITSSVTEKNPVFRYARSYSWADGELSDFNSARSNFSLGSYKESMVRRNDLNIDLFATYSKSINAFKLGATVGFNSLEQQVQGVSGTTNGGLVIPKFYSLNNSKSLPTADNSASKYRLMGAYANLSGAYKNAIFLEYSARNDWSSTLPAGKRGFFYQAGGISYVATNSLDIKSNTLSYLKIRGNVGSSGKDAPLYSLNNYFTSNPTILDYGNDFQIFFPFNGTPGAQKSSVIGNANLKPELTLTYEGGVDIGLFKDRVTIEYTYYHTNSTNQIVSVNLPWSTGYSSIPLNIGRMVNKGHELAIRATPIKTKSLDWKLFVTYSKNMNTVVSVAKDYGLNELNVYTGLVHFSGHGTMNMVAREGMPFGTFKGTDFVYDDKGSIVVDANGNPKQSSEQKYLGSVQPKYLASFGTDINYKRLQLHVLFDAKVGGKFFSATKMSTEFNGTAYTTLYNDRKPFVIPNSVTEDENGKLVSNTIETNAYQYYGKTLPASGYLLDASFLKLREVSLSYSIPNRSLRKLPFASMSFGVFAKNLKYWVAKENTFADPEVSGVGGASNAQGIETSTTPTSRSFGAELKFTFK